MRCYAVGELADYFMRMWVNREETDERREWAKKLAKMAKFAVKKEFSS